MSKNTFFRFLLIPILGSILGLSCCQKSDPQHVVLIPLSVDSIPNIGFLDAFHINSGKLYMSYSYSGSVGTKEFRRYGIDTSTHQLTYEKSYFIKDDNYRYLYDPIAFWDDEDNMFAYERSNPYIYRIVEDSLIKTNDALISLSAKVPREMVQEAKQAFYKSPRQYYFIGRGPKDSYQGIYLSNNEGDSTVITEVQRIIYDSKYPFWAINHGRLVYNPERNKAAFGFQLFPTIHIYDLEKQQCKAVTITKSNIDTTTFEEADMWSLNPTQFQFVTSNKDYIYALHWGIKYNEMVAAVNDQRAKCRIYKLDWKGNVVCSYDLEKGLDAIAVSYDDQYIIGHEKGGEFFLLRFGDE